MGITREGLLEGAASILETGPYDGLTIDALASTLHMSKSTLYKHFEGKDRLVDGLVDHLCEQTEREVDAIPRDRPAAETFRRLFDALGAHFERVPRAFILQPERLPRPCRYRIEDTRRRLLTVTLEVIERGVERGELRAASARAVGHAILAGIEAASVASARGEVVQSRREMVHGLRDVFAQGLFAH